MGVLVRGFSQATANFGKEDPTKRKKETEEEDSKNKEETQKNTEKQEAHEKAEKETRIASRLWLSMEWEGATKVIAVVGLLVSLATNFWQYRTAVEVARDQVEADDTAPERKFKKNVETAVARLREPFVFEDVNSKELSRIRTSDAATEVKKKAEAYWTQGIIVPPELTDVLTGNERCNPTVLEGKSGPGKSTAVQRLADGRQGVLYVPCKTFSANTAMSSFWEVVAKALNVPNEKDLNVGTILHKALKKYHKDFPNEPLPTIVIDDLDRAFARDKTATEDFISNCGNFFDEGIANSIFLGSDPIYEMILEAHIPGAAARFLKADFVERDPSDIIEPFANNLAIKFAENEANDEDSITPEALLPLATDVLVLVGPRYSDLLLVHKATSPDDLKRRVIGLVKAETGKTWRNVGSGTICRTLVESDAGMFVDTEGKYDGDGPLKCKNENGKDSDLVTENLVRKDNANVGGSIRPRFLAHHGAAFVAMAVVVRKADPEPKLGKAAIEVLATYDRLVGDLEKGK